MILIWICLVGRAPDPIIVAVVDEGSGARPTKHLEIKIILTFFLTFLMQIKGS